MDEPNNAISHRNTMLSSEQNKFESSRGMHHYGATQYTGSRTIYGSDDPTKKSTPGLPGDEYIQSPAARWVCTRGDYTKATWLWAGAGEDPAGQQSTAGAANVKNEASLLLPASGSSTTKPLFGTGSGN